MILISKYEKKRKKLFEEEKSNKRENTMLAVLATIATIVTFYLWFCVWNASQRKEHICHSGLSSIKKKFC